MEAANVRQLREMVAVSLARANMVERYRARAMKSPRNRAMKSPRNRRARGPATTAPPLPDAAGCSSTGWSRPVRFTHSGADVALSEGGSVASYVGDGCYASAVCGDPLRYDRFSTGSGQYFVEVTWLAAGSGAVLCAGVAGASFDPTDRRECAAHTSTDAWMYDAGWCGYLWHTEAGVSATRTSWEGMRAAKPGDRIGLLLDLSDNALSIFINGEELGVMVRGLKGPLHWVVDLAGVGTIVRITSAPMPSFELQAKHTLMERHATACTNTEWSGEAVWGQRPQLAAYSKANFDAHLREHLADLVATHHLMLDRVEVDRAVPKTSSHVDAWVAAAGSSSKGAPAFQRRRHSESQKAERVLRAELKVLAQEEKAAAEQAMLRAAEEAKAQKAQKAKNATAGNVFIGWGKSS